MKKWLLLLFAISLVSIWPFFKKGYFTSHDGEWMVIRFSAFHQTLASGQFPVRFVDRLNNNYGYPVLNFLYPLPFYLAEVPRALGFSFVDSIKIIFAVSTVFSAFAMFWALCQIFSKEASFFGAIIYLFTPYRFVDLYVRGSLGENLAFSLVPIVFGAILKIAGGKQIFLPILSLAVGLLILAHNVIAAFFLPLFILCAAILINDKRKVILPFILGILISAFFWVPALYDLQYVKLSQIKVSNVSDHLVDFLKLIIPFWGFGPNPNGVNPLPVQIGVAAIAIFIYSLYLRFKFKIKNLLFDIFLLIFVFILFLMMKYSLFIWLNVPFADIIQFPWRLLAVIVFITAYLAAFSINLLKKKTLPVMLLVLAAVFSTITYIKPETFVDRGDGFYATNEDTTTVRDEYLPLWINERPETRANQKLELQGEGVILASVIKPVHYEAVLESDGDSSLKINTIYFPGWLAKVDGKRTTVNKNDDGLMVLGLPEGKHKVIIYYNGTLVHRLSEVISLLAILASIFYLRFFLWRRQNF